MRFRKWSFLMILFLNLSGVAMAIEEPKYKIILSEGDIELRDYEPFIIAETHVEGTMEDAGSRAFRILANYIFGGNAAQEKISMTAPVSVNPDSAGSYRVTFSMPSKFTLASLPKPKDSKVILKTVDRQKMAAFRYSGTWSIERFEARSVKLTDWILAKKLKATGPAVFARYDAPWTPWFLRRNEVLIPVQD